MRAEAELWLKQGLKDLEVAEKLFEDKEYFAVSFFCHQAVEKVFKAAIIALKRISPEKEHNLRKLFDTLNIPNKEIFEAVISINPHYIISRYPDAAGGLPYLQYTEDKAREILHEARQVIKWLKEKLNLA